eukprot:gene20378-26447_t
MSAFDLKSIVRPNIWELEPYRCARDDYSEGVLLDANENSIGPAVHSNSSLQLNRYPDPLHFDVKERLSIFRHVKKEQIFLGVGSDEAIDILFRIFCTPKFDNVVITPPTYGMYKVCAKVNDVNIKQAPLTSDFDVDLPLLLSTIDINTKIIWLCSPGNPTSKVIPNTVVEDLVSQFTNGVVVVDEAYIDFSGTTSACTLINKYPNLIVLQTLSKAFGLAGIRLGMAYSNESIIQIMNNVKAPYNVNKLTADVALNALNDLATYHQNLVKILMEREYLLSQLRSLTFITKIHHTDANFILFAVPRAYDIYKTMADRGVVCRYRGSELYCTDCLRVTVGIREENDKFLHLLVEIASELGVTDK